MPARTFLSEQDEQRLVEAITRAEQQTSGEIRIHIEFTCKKDPLETARHRFHQLGMQKTNARNGVLIYVATDDKKAAIYGDEGISRQISDDFWQAEIDKLTREFKKENFEQGLELIVADIGEKLRQFFPGNRTNPNQLDNDISFLDNRHG